MPLVPLSRAAVRGRQFALARALLDGRTKLMPCVRGQVNGGRENAQYRSIRSQPPLLKGLTFGGVGVPPNELARAVRFDVRLQNIS
jgi:hypothetical protein